MNYLSKKIKVIKPEDKGKLFWDLYIVILNIIELLIIPIELGFIINRDSSFVENYILFRYFLYSCLCSDIILNFNTSYYQKGALIMTRPEISRHYLRLGFFIHVLSVAPYLLQIFVYGITERFSEDKTLIDFFKLFFLLRYLSVQRIFRRF